MEINDPMSSADFVDSRGRSRAIAAFMAVSPSGSARPMVEIGAGIYFRVISKTINLVSFRVEKRRYYPRKKAPSVAVNLGRGVAGFI